MLKKILFIIASAFAFLFVYIAFQPSEFQIKRTVNISASAAKIYPLINNFQNWPQWSPWAQLDKEMKTEYSGAPQGIGAIYSWAGNQQVGEGKMTIVESAQNAFVKIKLEFTKPFAAQNFAEFTLIPAAGGSIDLSWSMGGRLSFNEKLAHFVMNMDKMVGGEFEKGLNQIKILAENQK